MSSEFNYSHAKYLDGLPGERYVATTIGDLASIVGDSRYFRGAFFGLSGSRTIWCPEDYFEIKILNKAGTPFTGEVVHVDPMAGRIAVTIGVNGSKRGESLDSGREIAFQARSEGDRLRIKAAIKLAQFKKYDKQILNWEELIGHKRLI